MATHRLIIPDWTPTSLNKLLAVHHMVRHRLKNKDAEIIGCYARQQDIPKATCKRHVSLVVKVGGRGRLPDADNLLKGLLDSLVACGILHDDGPRWLELGSIQIARGERGTEIILEDMP